MRRFFYFFCGERRDFVTVNTLHEAGQLIPRRFEETPILVIAAGENHRAAAIKQLQQNAP